MKTVHTIKELRSIVAQQRKKGQRIVFVPTMGNLHEGHISLVTEGLTHGDFVITSIFVNPMQFGANEDLDSYPRTLEQDQQKLSQAGNHLVFAPSAKEIYPQGMDNQSKVIVPDITEFHCGASRPGHFTGVSTVVMMLFNMVQPDVAIFGQKDFQQLAVIRKMVKDLFMPIQIIGLPTARDPDGLAKSSRNGYLSEEERAIAPRLSDIINLTGQKIQAGARDFTALSREAESLLLDNQFKPDYFNIVDSETLKPAAQTTESITILAAAYLGDTRLIDNITI
ncbi:pantoate--beta-alanine ligase [Alkalimarinus alittae]|uniref:Pantothenate synthetase n=1 Tax=Alkalimarinus alittae TaxID=2961619 RepID=A0ABY6N189_9ALTE|nr:pantoate--beta-alanine ligase [Alkalimarinus alittae]UZE95878.1 pantoate--beta-alanine ligase [Alkalimarinus alittae]